MWFFITFLTRNYLMMNDSFGTNNIHLVLLVLAESSVVLNCIVTFILESALTVYKAVQTFLRNHHLCRHHAPHMMTLTRWTCALSPRSPSRSSPPEPL